MAKINELLRESTTTSSNSLGRPNLVALTRATTKLIYRDIIAEQRTSQPIAALYGVKYLTPDNEFSFQTGAVYGGEVGSKDRETIPELTDKAQAIAKGEYFKYQNIVYKALQASPLASTSATELAEALQEGLVSLTCRLVPDAAHTEKFEAGDVEISNAVFQVNKWNAPVKSRKLKTALTVELAQDMESNGFDAPAFLEDLLATVMADEINKDVLQSLITVSKRYKVTGVSDNGIIDLSYNSAPESARKLYEMVCEMNSEIQKTTSYSGTFVVASSRAAAMLAGSGWLKHKPEDEAWLPETAYGYLINGLPVFCDVNSPLDYVIVGVKEDYGGNEVVGSIFYAPYTEGLDLDDQEHVGAYKVIVDPDSLQPAISLMVRYALSANPYTVAKDDKEARVIDATNMDLMAGQSNMSYLLGVKLPPIIYEA
ncbi:capsid vertex protein [Escherichia phage JS98]|uniref:Capsid vertex protein n=2 Tax=Dhakavirus JS98 TaxID=2004457 RepID=A0A858I691_9CAUD|nr:capsid vertex protein [Escherichia phage JS98]AAU29302.2 gp24 head vertex protein [Escherichia phage JS98]QIN95796.1 capsid vertex protein [Escherichia phage MN04]